MPFPKARLAQLREVVGFLVEVTLSVDVIIQTVLWLLLLAELSASAYVAKPTPTRERKEKELYA